MKNKNIVYFVIIIAWSGFLFLFNLDKKGLWSAQEARNAIAARSMLNGGASEWIIPQIAWEKSTQKPVLFYWLVSASCFIGKSISPLYVRLPAAISGLLCVLYIFYAGRRIMSSDAGFLSAMILSTSMKFLYMSRISRIDIFLALCLSASVFEFFFYYKDKKLISLLTAYFFCALGVLSKGPVSIIIPFGIIICFLLIIKDIKSILSFFRIEGILLFLAMILPYYIAASIVTKGAFITDFIIKHNVERFTGMEGAFGKRKPFWFYAPHFLSGSLPWTLFLPVIFFYFRFDFGLPYLFKFYPKHLTKTSCDKLNDKYLYILLSFIVVFLFFSFASFKRSDYILPVYPFFAVLLGICLADGKFTQSHNRIFYRLFLALIIIILFAANILFISGFFNLADMFFGIGFIDNYFNDNDKISFISICEYLTKNRGSLLIINILSLFILFYALTLKKSPIIKTLASFIAIIGLAYFYFFARIEPYMDKFCTLETFANEIKHKASSNKVVFYHFWDHSLDYYMGGLGIIYFHNDLFDFFKEHPKGYFIIEDKWYNLFPDEIKRKCEIVLRTPQYHRKKLILARQAL